MRIELVMTITLVLATGIAIIWNFATSTMFMLENNIKLLLRFYLKS
jgi:hypothetical protein